MIQGVRLFASGITMDGDYIDGQGITLDVNESEPDRADVEVTLADGSTWSVDLDDVKRALAFAIATHQHRSR